MEHLLLVLTGKTASGKDTIMRQILNKFPSFKRVVSTTSRAIRPGEKEGIDYKFLTVDQFKGKINSGQLLEYVEYGGNFYGTEKEELNKLSTSSLIWRIDPSRAGEARDFIKRSYQQNKAEQLIKALTVIYITTSEEVILQRLKNRHLSEVEIDKRRSDDIKIWEENKNNYDFVVENVPGKLGDTISQVVKIIESHGL